MIVFIDLENNYLQAKPDLWQRSRVETLRNKYRLETVSGQACLIVRYDKLKTGILQKIRPQAVVVSGCISDFIHYDEADLAALRQIYLAAAQPIFGLCAGFQLMAAAHGSAIGAIGTMETAAEDALWFPTDHQREYGFTAVDTPTPHPMFQGLSDPIHVFESHYWEVKTAPPEFDILAATPLCPIQAVAHQYKPLWGTQFHPEAYDAAHPDGRQILENFFRSFVNEVERIEQELEEGINSSSIL